jgi:Transcriptional regulators, similar to M. xanthus CarD
MLSIGDKITHPMHGAGIIEEVVQQRVDGELRDYFVMRMTYGAMTVMVPKDSCEAIGVRAIIQEAEADALMDAFEGLESDENQNWNKRYRENMLKIKSGDLYQVAAVVKGLLARDRDRGLSTGERKLLSSAKQILISEIALAKGLEVGEIEHTILKRLV